MEEHIVPLSSTSKKYKYHRVDFKKLRCPMLVYVAYIYKAFHYLGKEISMIRTDFQILCDHAIIFRSYRFNPFQARSESGDAVVLVMT